MAAASILVKLSVDCASINTVYGHFACYNNKHCLSLVVLRAVSISVDVVTVVFPVVAATAGVVITIFRISVLRHCVYWRGIWLSVNLAFDYVEQPNGTRSCSAPADEPTGHRAPSVRKQDASICCRRQTTTLADGSVTIAFRCCLLEQRSAHTRTETGGGGGPAWKLGEDLAYFFRRPWRSSLNLFCFALLPLFTSSLSGCQRSCERKSRNLSATVTAHSVHWLDNCSVVPLLGVQ